MLDRPLPHSDKAEIAVLGAILCDGSCIAEVMDSITPDYFYNSDRRKIYEAMLELEMEGTEVTLVTVNEALNNDLPDTLVDIQNSIFTSAEVVPNVQILVDKYYARQIVTNAVKAVQDVYSGENVQDILDRLSGTALEDTRKDESFADILHQSFDEIDARREGKVSLVKSGLYELDNMLGGFASGKLIVIGGRTSQGKTALMCQVALHAADKLKKGVAMFELEMTSQELACRVMSQKSGVNLYKYSTGQLEEKDWQKVSQAMGEVSSLPFYILDRARVTLEFVRAKSKRLKHRYDIGLICVDYLQLMQMPKSERHDLAVGVITGGLKSLAKELGVPVLLLSQLSRDETKTNRRPTLSDLRNSGCIEQDADVVIFTYLPNKEGEPDAGKLIVAKHRNGPTGEISLTFNRNEVRFE